MTGYTISQIAKQVGVSTDTIRMYEHKGLIPLPPRSANGYRRYPHDVIRRLQFILRAKAIGFTLKEIHELLAIQCKRTHTCNNIQHQVEEKIATIDDKLQELQQFRAALSKLLECCHNNPHPNECPVLDILAQTSFPLGTASL